MATATDQYFDLKALSGYSSLGVGTLRDYPQIGLPHFKLKGKILVKRSEFDGWMEGFRVDKNEEVNEIVDGVIKGLSEFKSEGHRI
jgi:hypothetical protein